MKPRRTVDPYDPRKDAARRWPQWTIRAARIVGLEKIIYPDEQTILISDAYDEDKTTAQAVAHLDLGHQAAEHGPLPDEKQEQASWLAEVRLDAEASRESVGHIEPDTGGEQPLGE